MAAFLPQHPIPYSHGRKRIFESVFPPSASSTLPTPLATPSSSFIAPPSQSSQPSQPLPQTPTPSHGYNTRHHPNITPSPAPVSLAPSPAAIFAKESRAWHLATTYLSFPSTSFPEGLQEYVQAHQDPTRDVVEAIRYLTLHHTEDTTPETSLLEWYTCEVRRHFMACVRPEITIPTEYSDGGNLLGKILWRLTTAQSIYLFRLRVFIIPEKKKGRARRNLDSWDEADDAKVQGFIRSLNSVISYSLPDPAWNKLVYQVFLELCGTAVGLPRDNGGEDDDDTVLDEEEADGDSMSGDEDVYQGVRLSQQSFATEADLDGDIVVDDDGVAIGNPSDMDGIDEFSVFRKRVEEKAEEKRKKRTEEKPKEKARKKVLEIWSAMEKLGVGGSGRRGERVFAEVINTLLTTYINAHFAGVWETPSKVGDDLDHWVEHVLGQLVLDVLFFYKSANSPESWATRLKKLSPRESFRASRQSLEHRKKGAMEVDAGAGVCEDDIKRRKEDLESWKRIAIGRLGRLRVGELFDIVVEWPESLGGVEDLKSYITSPQTRLHLTTTFTSALSTRLLHPAAATSDILRAYISLIRAFTVLDPRGVLLDRVSRGIRRYLRERDDTVRVIVRGIMSESLPDGSEEAEDLSELAQELGKGIPATQQGGGLEELDYDDLSWAPDPVDAGPEFRRSKGLDVVGSLISLWESREIWTKEVAAVLSTRLLGSDEWVFEKEIRLIELLKLRFGETTMQGCDVMLKDIADSKRSDAHIRDEEDLGIRGLPEIHTKILSRLFWPTMKEDEFNVPQEIKELQELYERGFETLKKKRKITWLQTMGAVEVELELEDRVIQVSDAATWQAAVIYQFDEGKPDKWTIAQLSDHLDMEESLVKKAVQFWQSKDVLRETGNGIYTVIENLEKHGTNTPPSQAGVVAVEEEEEVSEDRKREKVVVEQFVIGMLTNGGAMALERISMMLGLVPGGFSWGQEELREFLTRMKGEGKVEYEGGNWRIPKT